MAYKILVVDDEPDLREILQCNLESAGYEVETAESAEEALEMLAPAPDLILLDVMMGGMTGYRMAGKLRNELKLNIPIIFLTAKDSENDMLTGFSVGADDYISKPFSLHEVLARVKAVLRRGTAEPVVASSALEVGGLRIDFEKKLVFAGEEELRFSPKEFAILSLLAHHAGRVYKRDEILTEVWQEDSMMVLDRTVDVHITRIRHKLGPYAYHITNRQGYGYCFEEK